MILGEDGLPKIHKSKMGLKGSFPSSPEDWTLHFQFAPSIYLDITLTMQAMEDLVFLQDFEHLKGRKIQVQDNLKTIDM